MAQRARISCINKTDRNNPHERITHVGGVIDGKRWRISQPVAVSYLKNGQWTFYVEQPPGHVVDVIVARSAAGHEYLKTEADGEQPNNLLALTECPVS